MKTAISLPDEMFESAERLARRLGMSRSQLFREALSAFLERHAEQVVTDRLNEVYGGAEPGEVDEALARMQQAGLAGEEW